MSRHICDAQPDSLQIRHGHSNTIGYSIRVSFLVWLKVGRWAEGIQSMTGMAGEAAYGYEYPE